jgi:tRNA (mo5U34)-methyltransferase
MHPSRRAPDNRTCPEEIRNRIADLSPWFHNLQLCGVQTAPDHFLGDYPAIKWNRFSHSLPSDLTGKSVLDIGCNAGFHAIQMKLRGADRVLGIDFDDRYLAQARLAAELSDLEIEFRKLSVYDVARLAEAFDVVLFLGVLYHLRHPLLALDLIHAHVARDLLVYQSMQRGSSDIATVASNYDFWQSDHFDEPGYPRLHFVEHKYADDETNWWIPNRACSQAMLRSAGFEVISNPEEEVFICRRRNAPYGAHGPRAAYPAQSKDERSDG